MKQFPKPPLDNRILGTEMEYTVGLSAQNAANGTPLSNGDEHNKFVNNLPFGLKTINTFLSNGGRFYLDTCNGVEYATPEVTTAYEAVAAEIAGERIIAASVRQKSKKGTQHVYKNVADTKGENTAGHHENYGVSSQFDRQAYYDSLLPHLITRLIFNGAGHFNASYRDTPGWFEIGQKAWDIKEVQTSSTTRDKPIINTRDEPHADKSLPRIHITSGDANIAHWAQWYTLLGTSAVLSLVERGVSLAHLTPHNPLATLKCISSDTSLTTKYLTIEGRHITAVDAQEVILTTVANTVLQDTDNAEFHELVSSGIQACHDAKKDPTLLADRVDWVAKLAVMDSWLERKHLAFDSPEAQQMLEAMDLLYGDLEDGIGVKLRQKGKLLKIVDKRDEDYFITNPPKDTRAHARGQWIKEHSRIPSTTLVNWTRWGGYANDALNPYDPSPYGI